MSFCAYFFVKVFPEQPQLSQLTLPLAEFKTACFSTSLLTLRIMIFKIFLPVLTSAAHILKLEQYREDLHGPEQGKHANS